MTKVTEERQSDDQGSNVTGSNNNAKDVEKGEEKGKEKKGKEKKGKMKTKEKKTKERKSEEKKREEKKSEEKKGEVKGEKEEEKNMPAPDPHKKTVKYREEGPMIEYYTVGSTESELPNIVTSTKLIVPEERVSPGSTIASDR